MEPTTFAGLNQVLESNVPIRKACQAVELCLEANRFTQLPLTTVTIHVKSLTGT